MKVKRLIEFLTFVHRVHHITHSYGWVFMPLMFGYFPDHKELYRDRGQNFVAWRFVNPKYFHNCTWTGIY